MTQPDRAEPEAEPEAEPAATVGPGLLRRARRRADLSQRGLAERLGVAQSTVARWETGRTSPTLAVLEQVAELAGMRLVMVGEDGAEITPMSDLAACDRAGRRYPAHLDITGEGWWVPPGSHLTVEGLVERRRSARLRLPQVRYRRRGIWRELQRSIRGTPADHPDRATLVSEVVRRFGDSGCRDGRRPIRQPD